MFSVSFWGYSVKYDEKKVMSKSNITLLKKAPQTLEDRI